MQTFNFPIKNKLIILALGAESAGNFSIFNKNKIYFSQDFGDLLEEKNWLAFQKAVLDFLKENGIKPDIILADLHPLIKTTLWGKQLSKKFKAQFIQFQHHHAHIFSAIGDKLVKNEKLKIKNYPYKTYPVKHDKSFYGIAMDGTGYGTDEKIWGGECFTISNFQFPISNQFSNLNEKISKQKMQIERIGHLENQILLGGELAIKEPARMLISILNKVFSSSPSGGGCPVLRTGEGANKKLIYSFIKKYYTKNEFELLYNQLEQGFNCIETSSTGRILDAVSLLLGFCDNQRKYKHEPIDLLEKNSTIPYKNLKPIITINTSNDSSLKNLKLIRNSKFKIQNYRDSIFILETTPLFEYLIKNINKDKQRLAATAQLYLAEGLYEIIIKSSSIIHQSSEKNKKIAAGGVTNNKIISKYFSSKNIYLNDSIPRGDAGLSFGQITYFLLKK